MESMECTLKETDKETAVEIPPSFEFTSYQQWQIAFIYAFAVTFNPHQEIAPSFYRLPEFSPKVCLYNNSPC